MEIVNQQPRLTEEAAFNLAQRQAVGFTLRNLFPLTADHPVTPFDDLLDQLDKHVAAEPLHVD